MDSKTCAEIHAKIAAKVYPGIMIFTDEDDVECRYDLKECCGVGSKLYKFNLLETVNGNPTQQAKASSLDVMMALGIRVHYNYGPNSSVQGISILVMNSPQGEVLAALGSDNPCATIYEAAKEIVEAEDASA